MHARYLFTRFAGLTIAAFVLLTSLTAEAQDAIRTLELPQDPRQWIGSPPLNLHQLQGKAVVLLFFEESCPNFAREWPKFNRLPQSHVGDPLLFIAVSSGTQRGQMESYIREHNLAWSVLLDPDRSFEKACDVPEINLETNNVRLRGIDANGSLQQGNWTKPDQLMERLLRDAKWTIDPTTIPASLMPAWQQVEFRNYPAAAVAIRKGLNTPKEDVKTAAETLMAVVQPLIDEQLAAAETAYDAGEKWEAFRTYVELSERFKGYDLPENVGPRMKELQADTEVKDEVAAFKLLDNAQRQFANPSRVKKGIVLLRKLAEDKPDTKAGQKAKELLTQLGADE